MSLTTRKTTTATGTHAVVQVIETFIQNQNLLGEIAELDEVLYDVIDSNKDNKQTLQRIVQCIYSLLKANNRWNVKFGSKVYHKLISVAIADAEVSDDVCGERLHSQLVENVLICVQIYVRKFPRIDGKFLLRQLWSLSLSNERQPFAAQILVKLFDDFSRELGEECTCSNELYAVIRNLLQSEQRDFRRSGHFLMRKIQELMHSENKETSVAVLRTLKCSEHQWSAYVGIMESLEEQQSHLVLPTLNTLLPHIAETQLLIKVSDEWLTWLRILYGRLLQDNNILVLRWTLSYFLNNFDLAYLCHAKLLGNFLEAVNKTQLYNVEGYLLPSAQIEKLMSQGQKEIVSLLEALVEVPWHSVPLHYWLSHMQLDNDAIIGKNLLLQLSSRVRTLRNTKLRKMVYGFIFKLFEATINSLSLGDYLVFIGTLMNIHDDFYTDHERLITKIENCKSFAESSAYFNKRCCEMIFGSVLSGRLIAALLPQLTKLPKNCHSWLRLFPLFELYWMNESEKAICLEFYNSLYDIDIDQLKQPFSDAQKYLIQKLNCQTKEEKSFVLEHFIDWYMENNIDTWSQIKVFQLSPLDLLERGSEGTFVCLAKLLKTIKGPLPKKDKDVIPALVVHLKKYQHCEDAVTNIVLYGSKYLDFEENRKIITDMLKYRYESVNRAILLSSESIEGSLVVQGILDGETLTGDARIESAYADSLVGYPYEDLQLRDIYIILNILRNDQHLKTNEVATALINTNNQLTVKKPRYFENCKEHRLKIRIARALLMIHSYIQWSDDMWKALLAACDQPNISYMYEALVAQLLPSFNMLLDKMQTLDTLKPSQQVSLISVAHIYIMLNWGIFDFKELQRAVGLLLPHTMGAHFQTRLLTQLVLHKLAVKCEECSIDLPTLNDHRISIERILGPKLQGYKNETRLLLPEIISECDYPADVILYLTNTPFDEYRKIQKVRLPEFILKARKDPLTSKSEALPIEIPTLNVQRKMNPLIDTYNCIDPPKVQDLIVVASLIDKLPNLGGLARTCEVLGVKSLALGNKSITEKPDFKNLSMTAEKTLNIIEVKPSGISEFLVEKQSLGYRIVGAEQTAHSVSFIDFKFPEKCILLLGHEKHGIPVDLIAQLDFAVEIPQFGMVRSLNVHVTGSLFIWEYCKQHISKK